MALDPRISLGYQPPQFQQRDVAQEQGQLMQLQNAMLQGQQLRREVAQEEGIANYLARNNLSTPEGRAGLRQFGKTGLAYEKLLSEQEANALKRQETEGKVREQRMKALGTGLMMVKDNPTDDNLAAAFNGLDATGVDTKPFRQQFANITDINQRKQLINSYVLSDPDARASLQFVQQKPTLVDQHGKKVLVDQNPESPTYLKVLREYGTTMTDYEKGTLNQGERRISLEGRRVAVAEEEAKQKRNPEFQQRMEYFKNLGQLAAKGDVAAKQEFPKLVAQANEAVQLVDQLVGKAPVKDASGKVIQPGTAPHPGFKSAVGMGDVYTLGIPGVAQLTPGTDAADFKALYDQVKSGAFLQAFQAIKGAGAITEKEGEKATAAITRMSLAQSEDEFLKAAREFQNNVRLGVRNAEQKVMNAGGVRPSAAPAQPGASKPTVSNW